MRKKKPLAKKWFFEFMQNGDEGTVEEFRVRVRKDPGIWIFDVWDSYSDVPRRSGRWARAGWVHRVAIDNATTLSGKNVLQLSLSNHPWNSPLIISPALACEMLVAYDMWSERCLRA